MTLYSVQPKDCIFVKGYGFLSFAENMGRNIDKNKSKSLSSKYSQKCIDHAKRYATDALKTASKGAIQKTAEVCGGWIGSKITDKITRVSITSPKNNSEIYEEEILTERYISSEQRQRINGDLTLI